MIGSSPSNRWPRPTNALRTGDYNVALHLGSPRWRPFTIRTWNQLEGTVRRDLGDGVSAWARLPRTSRTSSREPSSSTHRFSWNGCCGL